jgi:hypothetical protein
MKLKLCRTIIVVAILLAATQQADAQAPTAGLRAWVGYKSVDIDYKFIHDTHPDDSLPGAGVPGSAGQTELGRLHFVALSLRHARPIYESWSLNFDLGGLFGGDRDRHKNANDTRPDSSAAFVYSEVRFGILAASGLSYSIRRFYVGAEAQLVGLYVESGWDRFDKDDSQSSRVKLLPSVGPKIGYQSTDDWSVEGTVLFGRTVAFGVQTRWKF